MNYFVYNHHNFWQWEAGGDDLMYSDIVFLWADWPFRNEVKTLQGLGKKVIVYEHGFGAMFDYELNDREPIADGYIVLGQESKGSLIRVGVDPKRIIVAGNPIYDDIKKTKHKGKEALFVPLHWVRDLRVYNQSIYEQLRGAYPEYNWTVKLTDKTGRLFAERTWYNEVDSNILCMLWIKRPRTRHQESQKQCQWTIHTLRLERKYPKKASSLAPGCI